METSPDYDERVINVVTNARELSPERESFLRQTYETDATLYQEIAEALKWEDGMVASCSSPGLLLR